MTSLSPVRDRDAFVDTKTGRLTSLGRDWLAHVRLLLNRAVTREQSVHLTAQGAAIVTTNVPLNQLAEGLYRITIHTRITRAATVSSSVQVTIGFTSGGVALTAVQAALTANTTGTYESDPVVARLDKDSAVTYAATYASVGATSMQFSLDLVLERLPT